MVNIADLKEGDVLHVLDGDVEREGVVCGVSKEERLVCVDNGIQEFWYPFEDIRPVPFTAQRLVDVFGFEKDDTPEGEKFKKGAFRVLVHDPGNNTNLDIWYREDHRHFDHPIYLHELQNLHLEMTKVPLERATAH